MFLVSFDGVVTRPEGASMAFEEGVQARGGVTMGGGRKMVASWGVALFGLVAVVGQGRPTDTG